MKQVERVKQARAVIDRTTLNTQAQLWREMAEDIARKCDANLVLLKRASLYGILEGYFANEIETFLKREYDNTI